MTTINKIKGFLMNKKFLGILGIIVFVLAIFLIAKSSSKNTLKNDQSAVTNTNANDGLKPETNEQTDKLFYRKVSASPKPNLSNKQVTEIYAYNFSKNSQKLIFTDVDEEFTIQQIAGLVSGKLIIFATPLNETIGDLWEIQTDGSGTKKKITNNFAASFTKVGNDKIAFIAYDNISNKFALWTMGLDGGNRKKIKESKTPISDPVITESGLSFIRLDNNASGAIISIGNDGANEKEILKAKNETLYSLSYAKGKYAYIKVEKGAGKENLADVFIFDTSQNEEKRISNDKEVDQSPMLSQDGAQIAFSKNNKIWVGKSDGTELKAIADGNQPVSF